ncbi:hypothetical protein PR048_012509 [Dryococelus australis]|uniref:Uncharacterized protein n=1 Tax=Dryococelus australis TaxID=614101 RepID=A0ABQ9HQZ5_9NEOP|nr:hypothetical protein PR048_012509 [Dryococelus australis]
MWGEVTSLAARNLSPCPNIELLTCQNTYPSRAASQQIKPQDVRLATLVRFPPEKRNFNSCSTNRLPASHRGDPSTIPGRDTPYFNNWESCRTMPLIGRYSRGSPFSHALSFWRCSIPQSPSPALAQSHEYFANSFGGEVDSKHLIFSPAFVIGRQFFRHAPFNSEPVGLGRKGGGGKSEGDVWPASSHRGTSHTAGHGREIIRCMKGIVAHGAQPCSFAPLACQLDHSPLTKANQVQSPAGSSQDLRKWEIVPVDGTGRWVSRGLPFTPALHSSAASLSPHLTIIGSQDLVVNSHSNISPQLNTHEPELRASDQKSDSPLQICTYLNNEVLRAHDGDSRERPLTSGFLQHDSHIQKYGSDSAGDEHGSPWWEASSLPAQPPQITT